MIERLTVERIKEAANIVDVVGDFVKLVKKGVRYTGLCPFHPDRTMGNFIVYPKQNCFRCFACDKKGGPVEFLMMHERLSFPDAIRWLGRKYCIETDGRDVSLVASARPAPPPPLPVLALPWSMVTSREHLEKDSLVKWMKEGISWDGAQRKRIDEVLRMYHVGHSTVQHRHEFTLFWQIDERQRVRTGHLMKYGENGHRVKKDADGYCTDWIHSILMRRRNADDPWPFPQFYNPDKEEHRTTLFGLHLLNDYPDADICIVESEKTALLMAIAYGNHRKQLWMASCGMTNITRDRLRPIIEQKRRVVLYPDRDGVERWKKQAAGLEYDRVMVDARPVTEWWQEGDGEKADIADIVVNRINKKKVTEKPGVKLLIDRLGLEVCENSKKKDDGKEE